MNARGFGEVGDSEACELAVNPVRAGASSQRAPFSRGRGKKKKKDSIQSHGNGEEWGSYAAEAPRRGRLTKAAVRRQERAGLQVAGGRAGIGFPCMQLFIFVSPF